MIKSFSQNNTCNFYCDPEIYTATDSDDASKEQNVYSFPSGDFGAYAASFPTEICMGSVMGNLSTWISEDSGIRSMIKNARSLESSPILTFWERYQAYPKYLKNVDKRKKKREKRKNHAK